MPQYQKQFTDALQFMWGDGFLSPGGAAEVAEMLSGLDLSGKRILDIGSGLGGVDVLLISDHGAGKVVGIDVESDLVEASKALVASKGLTDRIEFRLVEPGPLPFEADSFDMVFSKDAMVHIPDKGMLYGEILRVLRKSSWFVAADWLWAGNAEHSPVVQDWLSKGPLKFAFTTPLQAQEELERAGFENVSVSDQRAALQYSNRVEVETLKGPARERLAQIVGDQMASSRLTSAIGRQRALDSGDLIPCHLRGQRPASR
jgi:ubiquinone/menaquinone biosynthesis C-methylase UbiE